MTEEDQKVEPAWRGRPRGGAPGALAKHPRISVRVYVFCPVPRQTRVRRVVVLGEDVADLNRVCRDVAEAATHDLIGLGAVLEVEPGDAEARELAPLEADPLRRVDHDVRRTEVAERLEVARGRTARPGGSLAADTRHRSAEIVLAHPPFSLDNVVAGRAAPGAGPDLPVGRQVGLGSRVAPNRNPRPLSGRDASLNRERVMHHARVLVPHTSMSATRSQICPAWEGSPHSL